MTEDRERPAARWVLLLVLGTALSAWIVFRSPLFALRHVRVEGTAELNTADVVRLGGVRVGGNLVTLSTAQVEQALRRSPWIERASVHRSLPSTLEIRITERRPAAWLPASGGAVVVATDGVVLSRGTVAPADLPRLVGVHPATSEPGDRIAGAPALRVAGDLPSDLRRRARRVAGERGEVEVVLDHGVRILYGTPTRLAAKHAAARGLLRWAARHDLRVDYVDVRIPSSPVLRPAGVTPSPTSPPR